MPLFPGMPAFPGDPLYATEPVHRIARGDAYNISRVTLGTHAGTHVDPPIHFVPGGATVDQLDLGVLNGPCTVVDLPQASEVGPAELAAVPPGTARVLLRTRNSGRWEASLTFFDDYVAVTLDGARRLRELGVGLVGIDALSVERDPTGTFPVHHELLGHGVLIVEGLRLAPVPAGPAELACLPLLLKGGDGGPARATVTVP